VLEWLRNDEGQSPTFDGVEVRYPMRFGFRWLRGRDGNPVRRPPLAALLVAFQQMWVHRVSVQKVDD
jgi:hypothetical protein